MRKQTIVGRYWNSNGFAVSVVAVVNYQEDLTVFDWAAYIGGTDRVTYAQDAHSWVERNGDKLSEKDARHFFPDLPATRYRS